MKNKNYKCKICGWYGRLDRITTETEKEFNIDCRTFTYKDVLCPDCNYRGIVENETTGYWICFIAISIMVAGLIGMWVLS